jgi:hypothetical protein
LSTRRVGEADLAVPSRRAEATTPQSRSCVVAITVVSPSLTRQSASSLDVLLGARRAECNDNHKDVVSVPTMRVPRSLFAAIRDTMRSDREGQRQVARPASRRSEDPVSHAVEAILSRKLGMADALEYDRLRFSADPRVIKSGISPLLVEGDVAEPLQMINILVRLTSGREWFPCQTASYSAIQWFDAADTVRRIRGNERFEFNSSTGPKHYLCGGLCMCTAEVLVAGLLT